MSSPAHVVAVIVAALFLVSAQGRVHSAGEASPANLAGAATATASTSATPVGDQYGPDRANDGDPNTHWASGSSKLPQWLRLDWAKPTRVDTVQLDFYAKELPSLYAAWKTAEIELSDGFRQPVRVEDPGQDTTIVRLPEPHTITWLAIHLQEVHEVKTYVGVDEIRVHLDPTRLIGPPKEVHRAKMRTEVAIAGQEHHPTVYLNAADLKRAARNAERTTWGAAEKQSVLNQAERWLTGDDADWRQFLPEAGACYAYGFVACPRCSSSWGTWGGARCSWDKPGKVTCANGHELPDADHPDDGTGWKNPDGRVHYMVGSWNAWVTEQWTTRAIPALAHAYALTGEEKYADRAGLFLDLLASIYTESTAGSWDYPSSPPSGRFARPWYQVARTLAPFVEAYDLVYDSQSMLKPSLRPELEEGRQTRPTPQQRAVGTADENGQSWAGMTRRDNINKNLMEDGAYYCYSHTFSGAIHNGHADYMRGALAVGVLLGIPDFVHNAVESPYSIYAMLANNVDRDGRYYETALGYEQHTHDLYLTFVEPLLNWRDQRYPEGVRLFDDPRMLAFYRLPALGLQLCGHAPNYGDAAPDNQFLQPQARPFDGSDYNFAERLYAGCRGEAKQEYAKLLNFLCDGDVEKQRAASGIRRWLLYHADPVPAKSGSQSPQSEIGGELQRQVFGSWFLGQKGIGLLRDGEGANSQGVLLRYGPSLNHGDLDDLGLLYYAKGWQCTSEIGYGLGSTHSHMGWGQQTASHSLVVVEEKSQHGGSGGSLRLFCRLPGLKLMEADSPLSYADRQVSLYRRTVALIGEGDDQVLVDLFRVKGGCQHDYLVGSQGQNFQVAAVDLGPEEDGSLAGPENAWGERQGVDGDLLGFPNKPYWNPPPGNGYGFFYDARRGRAVKPWSVDWSVGGPNQAHFRVHVLPEGDDEAIVAKAPGLYPHNRNASYLINRRRGDNLSSCFASVMEPYAAAAPPGGVSAEQLAHVMTSSSADTRLMPEYDAFLLKGTRPGDQMTFSIPVERSDTYQVAARILQAPSYGAVRLLVDDKSLGKPFVATAEAIKRPEFVVFGELELATGKHEFCFEMTADSDQYLVSVGALNVTPADAAKAVLAPPRPVLSLVERLPVRGEAAEQAVAVHLRRADLDEYVVSAEVTSRDLSVETFAGPLRWSGAAAYVGIRDGEVVRLALHGAGDVSVAGCTLRPQAASLGGEVRRLDYDTRWVETSAKLPVAGLEGEPLLFSNPRYSRNTAYRISRLEPVPGGTRIYLGTQPMLLGQGRVHQVASETSVLSDIPHDYGRSVVGGSNPRFFDGKLLRLSRGVETHLKQIVYGSPMQLDVDSTAGLRDGDTLFYYDVQVGDSFVIPASVWAARQADGTWETAATVAGDLVAGARPVRIPASGL